MLAPEPTLESSAVFGHCPANRSDLGRIRSAVDQHLRIDLSDSNDACATPVGARFAEMSDEKIAADGNRSLQSLQLPFR